MNTEAATKTHREFMQAVFEQHVNQVYADEIRRRRLERRRDAARDVLFAAGVLVCVAVAAYAGRRG